MVLIVPVRLTEPAIDNEALAWLGGGTHPIPSRAPVSRSEDGDALRGFFSELDATEVTMTYDEIEEIYRPLPPSGSRSNAR